MPDGHYPGVYTASGKGDDYGRTERQRLTMQAILKKVKQLSPEEMIELAEVIMPNVKTDVDERDIYSYLLAVVRMGTTKSISSACRLKAAIQARQFAVSRALCRICQATNPHLKSFSLRVDNKDLYCYN